LAWNKNKWHNMEASIQVFSFSYLAFLSKQCNIVWKLLHLWCCSLFLVPNFEQVLLPHDLQPFGPNPIIKWSLHIEICYKLSLHVKSATKMIVEHEIYYRKWVLGVVVCYRNTLHLTFAYIVTRPLATQTIDSYPNLKM